MGRAGTGGRKPPTPVAATKRRPTGRKNGEVTRTPLAVVAPATVRVRGAEWGWPDEGGVRRLARLAAPPGLRRASLRDDPRRVVLEAEELLEAG